MTTRKELEEQLWLARRQIDAAYWTFTRCARGKPPSSVVPEAYDTVRRVTEELARRDAKRRGRRCVLLALLLFGCGGPPFTSLDLAAPDGGVASTGGQETVRDGSGGQSSPDGGGAPGTGGAASGGVGAASGGVGAASGGVAVDSGGSPATGGASAGGGQATGGAVASGGTSASGGSPAAGGAPGSGGAEAGGAGGTSSGGSPASGGFPGSGGASTGGSPDTGGAGGTDTGGSPGTGGSCSSCWCVYPGHTVLCAPTEFGFACPGPAPDPLCHSVTFQGHEVFCCPKPSYP